MTEQASVRRLRTTFIHNPVSGPASGRGHRRERLEEFIRSERLDASVSVTTHGGHARELAREAVERGAQMVVSVGGDGTMNEVASALVGSGIVYGMLPMGSGNGLARDLGLPLDFEEALRCLVEGRVRAIDTGVVNGLPFFNVMGFGFDAEIGRLFNESRRRGFLMYLHKGFKTYFSFRKQRATVTTAEGVSIGFAAFLAAVANSTQYGNNARIAPRALLDDGRLDLAVITTKNILAVPSIMARLFAGSVDRSRWVTSLQSTSFSIRREAPGLVHTDGEVHTCDAELQVAVRPASLHVLVPRPAS